MKGMIFTEFLEMVESKMSSDMVDDIIDDSNLSHGGAYTTVGNYDHAELVAMLDALSKRTGIEVSTLVQEFGLHLFRRFSVLHPKFFQGVDTSLDFLEGIENVIHSEVRKLYPNAELPEFICTRSADGLEMVYISSRHFGDLAEGLIKAAINYFGDSLVLMRKNMPNSDIVFNLKRVIENDGTNQAETRR